MDPEVERSPDRQPSHSRYVVEDRGRDVVAVLEVRGLGAIVIRGTVANATEWHGVSIFSTDELQFD
jgi:hypothetical protein